MLVGNCCSANTFPTIENNQMHGQIEHEASTSKLNEEQLFYLQSRGISREDAIQMVVGGFCKSVIEELPLEFAEESKKIISAKARKLCGVERMSMLEIKDLKVFC